MKFSQLGFCLAFLILAIVIFFFADGLKRYYSGGFFLIISIALFVMWVRTKPGAEVSNSPEEA